MALLALFYLLLLYAVEKTVVVTELSAKTRLIIVYWPLGGWQWHHDVAAFCVDAVDIGQYTAVDTVASRTTGKSINKPLIISANTVTRQRTLRFRTRAWHILLATPTHVAHS